MTPVDDDEENGCNGIDDKNGEDDIVAIIILGHVAISSTLSSSPIITSIPDFPLQQPFCCRSCMQPRERPCRYFSSNVLLLLGKRHSHITFTKLLDEGMRFDYVARFPPLAISQPIS